MIINAEPTELVTFLTELVNEVTRPRTAQRPLNIVNSARPKPANEVDYEMDIDGSSLTDCSYKEGIKVSSYYCCKCSHYDGHKISKQIVFCKYGENKDE